MIQFSAISNNENVSIVIYALCLVKSKIVKYMHMFFAPIGYCPCACAIIRMIYSFPFPI